MYSLQGDNKEETKIETGPRLFIGGLHYKTRDTDLQQHFEKYGKLAECQVARTKQRYGGDGKGRSRGYGFVTMSTQAETDAVLVETHVINDKVVAVMVSKPRDVRAQTQGFIGVFKGHKGQGNKCQALCGVAEKFHL